MTSDHAATGDHTADIGHDPAEIDKHVRVYITVFVALMALTIITVAVSYLHLAVSVALFIATVKGTLVAGYFMHLLSEKKLILAVLALTVVFFAVLLAVPVVTHSNGFWIPE